jgi:hypothetical protein
MAATMSWRAVVHTIAFFVAFISLVAAILVFVSRFLALGHRGWAAYCAATGLLPLPVHRPESGRRRVRRHPLRHGDDHVGMDGGPAARPASELADATG